MKSDIGYLYRFANFQFRYLAFVEAKLQCCLFVVGFAVVIGYM